jgi:integrase
MTLGEEVSRRIATYRPRMPAHVWTRVGPQVRTVVAAARPTTPDQARQAMHALARLAAWADAGGLPPEPDVWLRTETIDAFVLARVPRSAVTYRSMLRRLREALVWVRRGEAPPVRMSAPTPRLAPYDIAEMCELLCWARLLPGQGKADALALLALGAGCGLVPREIVAARGTDFRVTGNGAVVFDPPGRGRPLACRASWEEELAELVDQAGPLPLFRPQRTVAASRNLICNWCARTRTDRHLPNLSTRRLRATWIVDLLTDRIDHAVIAEAAGMTSPAALAAYHRFVPELGATEALALLRGHRP